MKEPFKIGDMVRVKGFDGNGMLREGERGLVDGFLESIICTNLLKVRFPSGSVSVFAPSQLVKYVPKRRREIWVTEYKNDEGKVGFGMVHASLEIAEKKSDITGFYRIVHFREVGYKK